MPSYTLKNICACEVDQQADVLALRNAGRSEALTLNDHLNWIEALKSDETCKVFVVLLNEDKMAGLVSVSRIDALNKTAVLDVTLGDDVDSPLSENLWGFVTGWAFEVLGLEKLGCELLSSQSESIAQLEALGFTKEGVLRAQRLEQGARVDVHCLGITREKWTGFEPAAGTSLGMSDATQPHASTVIDEIQKVRSRNNVNWMALLRLVVEHSEETGSNVIAEIMKADAEINDLTRQLVEETGKAKS